MEVYINKWIYQMKDHDNKRKMIKDNNYESYEYICMLEWKEEEIQRVKFVPWEDDEIAGTWRKNIESET